MPKIGRNDSCPCGSGKKYKHCCLEKDQAAQRARALAEREAWQQADDLDEASNAVIHMVREGRLDEAEQAARELLIRYPEVHDGYDRLGMVHEARGQLREAADCYRKVIEFVRARPESYDPEFADTFLELIAKLDASAEQAEGPAKSDPPGRQNLGGAPPAAWQGPH